MQAVMEGWGVVPRPLLDYLVSRSVRSGTGKLDQLNDDERSLWRMVASGADNNGIADRLYVSERTAKRLIAALLKKIGAANRFEAATLAGRAGLFDDQ